MDDYLNERALRVYVQTSVLGFVTGIRSMSSLALLGWTSDKSQEGMQLLTQWLPLVAALGETIADKLPVIPSRTTLAKVTKIPDPVLGILEDAVVSGLGMLAVRKVH